MTNPYNFKPASNTIYNANNPPPEVFEQGVTNIKAKEQRIREYRAEASRMASMANKRIQRLEANQFTDSPAYKRYIADGGQKFGVRGKTYNEVQQEVSRLRRFLGSETSTIRGVTNTLKDMAENTGIKYDSIKELRAKSAKFFELASKVEEYLRVVDDMASAIGYQQIWEAINVYTDAQGIRLEDGSVSVDGMVKAVTDALKAYDEPVPIIAGWYSLKED